MTDQPNDFETVIESMQSMFELMTQYKNEIEDYKKLLEQKDIVIENQNILLLSYEEPKPPLEEPKPEPKPEPEPVKPAKKKGSDILTCICGVTHRRDNSDRHLDSKFHKKYVADKELIKE